ncbi:DUF6950 family protein [Brucella endophytica]|nr:hypothetical protein [Brucella endophytica]
MKHLDWEKRLVVVTERHLRTPCVWGESDCLLTVADAIEAMTGTDYAADIRGKYKSKTGAYRLIKKLGHADLASVLAGHFEEIPQAIAMRGDVGIYDSTAGYFTEYGFALKADDGLRFIPRTMATKAFKVT